MKESFQASVVKMIITLALSVSLMLAFQGATLLLIWCVSLGMATKSAYIIGSVVAVLIASIALANAIDEADEEVQC